MTQLADSPDALLTDTERQAIAARFARLATQHPPISDDFQQAVHAHLRVLETLGPHDPEAACTMAMMLHHAPGWFRDAWNALGAEFGLLPEATGYLADGTPMARLGDVAAFMGMTVEETFAHLQRVMAERQALGLPIDGVLVDPADVYWRQ